jgi:RNA polymerase sigma factor (sigma-70 family)
MENDLLLLRRFEGERPRLRAVAHRMLGSVGEADDAVQEAWLRLNRAETGQIENLSGWLTTVVSRICLNMLRSRETRREDSLEFFTVDWLGAADDGEIPEDEAVLADEVGLALLVVLDTLSPAERIAFVLHDLFDAAFDDIAPMMERTAAAVRQLASRARRKVHGVPAPQTDPTRQRQAVHAYLLATRTGDFEALLRLLDPDVVLHADPAVVRMDTPITLQGALAVAKSAIAATARARFTAMARINGQPALVMAPLGHLTLVIRFVFTQDRDPAGGKISVIDVIAEPEHLREMEIAVLDV